MPRRLLVLLVAGIVVASCSGGNGSSDALDSLVETATSADVDGAPPTTEEAPDPSAPSTTEVPPELPGLLDTVDDPIPNDTAVRTGTLPNGLRYYIRSNDNPGGKADLRLAVRAGSVDEFGPSTGVAHFVEHMLFNGTEQFPENELIDVLRGFGASFGPDINAYTSFDETVYSLVVPNDDQTVELGLTVLSEWLSAATFDPDQVVSERGVVLDEWRVRTQTTSGRLFDVAADLYLAGSPYEGRTPIGTDASISAMEAAELRAYYDSWYRPDNVAVVVVGDIDVDEIDADIQRLFGGAAPRTEAAPGRPDTAFGLEAEPDFRLHSDPDQQTVDVEVTLPLPAYEGDGTASNRAAMIDGMISRILVRRLQRDLAGGTAPFDEVTPGSNSFVTTLDAPALYAFTDEQRVGETLDALLDEYVRALRFGFDQAEVDTAKASLRSAYQSRFDGRESTQDREYADEYVEHFLRGTPYPSIADGYAIQLDLLERITPADLEARFAARWANTAPHVIISTPESKADLMPTRDEVLAAIATERDVEPREALRDLPDTLMERPAPVAATSRTKALAEGFSYFDPVDLVFPNGVRVRLNTNTIVEGQVYLQASSPGGTSLVADDDVIDALYATDVAQGSGVGEFDRSDLAQILAATDASVNAYLTPYTENFYGSAATTDLETLFQLIHLYMTEPRFDPVAIRQVIAAEGPEIADPSIDPTDAGTDALLDARYQDELRYTVLPSPDEFETLDLAGVERVWNERYGDAGDWVFVLSGDFDTEVVVDLASSYLGTLPGTATVEQPIDVEPPPPATVVTREVVAGTGDTAELSMLFTSPVSSIDASLRAHTDVVTSALSARLTDVIRERFGETYSPYVTTYYATDPDPVIETYVAVSGAPDRIDQLAGLVIGEFADLAANGPADGEFANAYAEVEEAYGFVDNGQFLQTLIDDAIEPALPLEGYLDEYFALADVTAESVRAYVATHIPTDAYVAVTVTPR